MPRLWTVIILGGQIRNKIPNIHHCQKNNIKKSFCILKIIILFSVSFSLINSCFENRFEHFNTEFPQSRLEPLVKLRNGCEIPERKTTTLKTAKFVSQCQFATINFRALGDGSVLLPTGDQMEKENKVPTPQVFPLILLRQSQTNPTK